MNSSALKEAKMKKTNPRRNELVHDYINIFLDYILIFLACVFFFILFTGWIFIELLFFY